MLFLQVLLFPRTHSSSRCTLDDKRTAAEADFTGQTFHFAGAEKCSRPWKMALKIFQEGKVSFSPHHKSNFWMAKIADALSPLSTRSRSRSQAKYGISLTLRRRAAATTFLALVRWRAAKVHQRNMLMRCARKTQWGRDIKKVSLIYRWIPDTRWYPRELLLF